ncbi:MAG TPA: hypothetical protein VGJ91_04890 [Polyangiaceae bacterium]|jgi:hypothetical protein
MSNSRAAWVERIVRRASLRVGVALTVALAVLSACGDQDQCVEPECPAFGLGVVAADGSQLSGVQATLSGPMTELLYCNSDPTVTTCFLPAEFDTAGTYSLHVTANGFKSVDLSETVTFTPPGTPCTCHGPNLNPRVVTLTPSPQP